MDNSLVPQSYKIQIFIFRDFLGKFQAQQSFINILRDPIINSVCSIEFWVFEKVQGTTGSITDPLRSDTETSIQFLRFTITEKVLTTDEDLDTYLVKFSD